MDLVVYFASYWPEGVSLMVAEEYLFCKELRRGEYPLLQIGDKCIWEKMIPVNVVEDAPEERTDTVETALYWPR